MDTKAFRTWATSASRSEPIRQESEDEVLLIDTTPVKEAPASNERLPPFGSFTSLQHTPESNMSRITTTPMAQRSRMEVVLDSIPRHPPTTVGPDVFGSDVANGEDTSDAAHQRQVSRQPQPRGFLKPASSSPTSFASANIKGLPPGAATVKKRGRPKGWRPGLSYDTLEPLSPAEIKERAERAAKNKAARMNLSTRKRRGRAPRRPSPVPKEIYDKLNPEFIPFGCEWKGCKAELHNMATLRRHVVVVHSKSETCVWGKCAELSRPVELPTQALFDEHMEAAHLRPYVWHMGDGPRNDGLRPTENAGSLPAYLFDENGSQVTPSIRDQEIEDLLTYRANRRRLKALLIQRDKNAPLESDSTDAEGPGMKAT
jgi:hypothetical protein